MSKKWLNPPLSLHPKVIATPATDEDPNDSTLHAGIPNSGVLSAPETPLSALNRDSLSEVQYAFARPLNQFLDLPSAVPFQDSVTPALPSAEFPSSVRGGNSPPVTSSTANFGPSTDSIVAAYLPSSPSEVRHSEHSHRSMESMLSNSATMHANPPTTVATITLRRAESSASRASAWTVGDGSDYNSPLDITQFPRPPISDPGQVAEESPHTPSFPVSTSMNMFRRIGRLRPPASPLYEESEPSASPVMTPVVGAVSYQYPLTLSERVTGVDMGSPNLTAQNVSMADMAGNHSLQVPASPVPTSTRGSYQSHATAASRGSESPRLSIADTFGQNSVRATPSPGWDQVMNVVKPNWNTAEIQLQSTPPSPSSYSTKAVVETSHSGRDDGSSLAVPPETSLPNFSPMSGDSSSDVYSAIGRMSFPKPPMVHSPLSGSSSPVTPGHPRSPWITGITLRTKQSRGSLASSKRRLEETPVASPVTPVVPPLPFVNFTDTSESNSEASSPADNLQDGSTHSPSQGDQSLQNAPQPENPSQARNSELSAQAPSYDRRVSDLVRAANEDPRISTASDTSLTSASLRSSVDGAVVGVARAASLSARAKILLTRGPSIGHSSQEVTLPYIVPSPLPSAIPSEMSLTPSGPEIPSTAPLNLKTIDIRQEFLSPASSRAAKVVSFFRKKPLPPLPTSSPQYVEGKQLPHPDDNMSVQELAKRAVVMDEYLAVGELPYRSPITSPAIEGPHRSNPVRVSVHSVLGSLSDRARFEPKRSRQVGFAALPSPKQEENAAREETPPNVRAFRNRRKWALFVVFICVAAIGLTAAVLFARPKKSAVSVAACNDEAMTGATCQLNATCICTSTAPGQCAPVAQSLLDLLPSTNEFFSMNITEATLALTLWDLQGQQMGSCATQAQLVDVAPALNQSSYPKRTQWARSAILYNLVQSYDLASTAALRQSVASADFHSLQGVDEPVPNDSSVIAFQASGFVYDFASMTFAPSAVDWETNSGASQVQISRVGFFADKALDRMYSFSTGKEI
ncbi:hypothetical protein FRC20_008550 [Serendipita sp. 405]|nr:hypothetical protein FRC20_008550 [Serendipita sp. 405]